MSKLNTFAVFGMLFLSSILLANGMYSNSVSIFAEQENEAEINADIEQENKCKKDTECENENEINNLLNITTITQTQEQTEEQTEATLNVIKTLTCTQNGQSSPCPERLTPDKFIITVTGNNPSPSQFPGSEEGTLVTLGAGGYTVEEESTFEIPTNAQWSAEFSGDCEKSDDFEAEGTIAEGEAQTCTIENRVNFLIS